MAANNVWLRVVLVVSVLAGCVAARAENHCPWMTEATAGGLLGGAAVGSYTAAMNGKPAVCSFVRKEGGATLELTITVEVDADAHGKLDGMMRACGAGPQRLQAIGNEAAFCATDAASERVVGRVRDQVFTITLGTAGKEKGELDFSALQRRLYTASEQVAGNLF